MKKYISRFHYLTQDLPHRTHREQVQIACEAGANWIQYRCLSKPDEALLEELHQVAAICDDWGATLIVTNHVHLVHLADIQGVHIEDMAADLAAIRKEIGEDKTLGCSAHSIDDIRRHWISGAADYVGCGPFAVTQTKPNNFPPLGTIGYEGILQQLIPDGIDLPLIAVGGINAANVTQVLATGVFGVAVSGAVNLSPEPGAMIKEIYRKVL
ncbi:thiamine phosphate synthase [Hufsiella ginkgonis]|uniref:Thiamine phosphate synthase n=1 Tax=Hufsiella ginkgonis TaxID=2695274 RepID=A0A7K1XVF3_9SPHI|nr:thiamine phosphate synthase [Hufsiella ginkgonis]MXV14964.1 thiamine phosphate synthase [Hufsiella ginkgonis]